MSTKKKLVTVVLVVLLAFNMLFISASAEADANVGVTLNLQVGKTVGGVFVPLAPGTPLAFGDVITVRCAPQTDFLAGGAKFIVMFTTAYFDAVSTSFVTNTANTWYATSCTNWSKLIIPYGNATAWKGSLRSDAMPTNTAVAWTSQTAGSRPPSYMPGTWLFSFDLTVKATIPTGAAKIWMDERWYKTSLDTTPYASVNKSNDPLSNHVTTGKYTYPFTFDVANAIKTLPTEAQSTDLIVTTTQVGTDFVVNLDGWTATDKYQIWSYQQVTSDDLLDITPNVKANQWILSQAYTAGSAGAPSVPPDGTINFTIPVFTSPTDNFVIAVRVIDAAGNFKQEVRDAYTPTELGIVVIDKVLVDGAVTTGYELKEIVGGAKTLIKVIGNDEVGITYSAKAIYGPELILIADPINTNEFLWDISALLPGVYTIVITATNGNTTATQEIIFELFATSPSYTYASIDDMTLVPVPGGVEITPTFANGNFSYKLREPGRSPSFSSGGISTPGTITHEITAPGVYHVYGYAIRAGLIGTEGGGYDDGLIRTLVIPRAGGGGASMTFTANITDLTDVPKGTEGVFTATATGLTNPQYSFWRYDATGYVLVQDWSTDNTLNWTSARIGSYSLEARAKGEGAGSYEVKKNLDVNITGTGLAKADVASITLNTAELAAAQAKKPIMLEAAATGTDKDKLLYKFYVYDDDMLNQQLKDYSVDQYCVWTPREAGTYTIIVLVKNEHSFGKYDAIKSFEVTAS